VTLDDMPSTIRLYFQSFELPHVNLSRSLLTYPLRLVGASLFPDYSHSSIAAHYTTAHAIGKQIQGQEAIPRRPHARNPTF
jgi:hypothetical protein